SIHPDRTTEYTLTAWNEGGSVHRTITVEVLPRSPEEPEIQLPSITHFSASPEVIHPGGQLTLTWAVTGDETTVTITPEVGSVASSGSRQVQAETTTTYTLTAENSAGVVTADAVATVNLPPSAMFTQSET